MVLYGFKTSLEQEGKKETDYMVGSLACLLDHIQFSPFKNIFLPPAFPSLITSHPKLCKRNVLVHLDQALAPD